MLLRFAIDEVRRRTSSSISVNARGRENLSRTAANRVPDSNNGVSHVSGHCDAVNTVKSSYCMMQGACS